MTWGREAAEAQEALAQKELADLERGVVPKSWGVLGGLLLGLQTTNQGAAMEDLHLLDVGCGVASASTFIWQYAGNWIGHYCGIDMNPAAIKYASDRAPECYIGNIHKLNPKMREVFHIVLSNGTLNHLARWDEALGVMARLCSAWLILHRLWVYHDDTPTDGLVKQAYGQDMWHMRINDTEMAEVLDGFELVTKRSSNDSGDPDAGWTYVFEREG